MDRPLDRRSFLAATATVSVASLAGCTSLLEASKPDGLEGIDADRQLPVPTLGGDSDDGGDGETVLVAVYEDLGCPHCQDFEAEVFPVLEADYIDPGEIEYRHYDFPVMAADESLAMANAARAVQDDTRAEDDPNGRFFEYKRAVMENDIRSDDDLIATAETVGADPDAVATALEDETYYPTLAADWERGDEEGVERTPTVVVDGESVDEPTDPDAVTSQIDSAL